MPKLRTRDRREHEIVDGPALDLLWVTEDDCLDLDLRILLTWDADMTDIDIHVTEPSGELARYDHNLATIGGLVSRDFAKGAAEAEARQRSQLEKARRGLARL